MAANASGGGSYTLPVASASTLGGIKVGENLTIEEDGTLNAPDMSNYLSKTNTTSYTPTSDYNPATKKYVDDAISSAITTSLEASY